MKFGLSHHPAQKYGEDAMYYFKKTLLLRQPQKAQIHITADARYKLWINGKMASFGPYKGTGHHHYYNTVDITSFLKDGENELVAQVLQLAPEKDISQHKFLSSVPRSGNMAFLLWGCAECADGKTFIQTDGSWLCAKEENLTFLVPEYAYYAGMGECALCNKELVWTPANQLVTKKDLLFYGETKLWNLKGHDLPPQRYELKNLDQKDASGNYDFGKIVTGFVRITATGHGKLKLTYAECYVFENQGTQQKKNRTDSSGVIRGDYDIIEVNGKRQYETFWFRTFRYLQVEGDVEIEEILVAETGYPLNVSDDYDFGTQTDNTLWDLCVHTLKCCMHETYEDCPYYEQLQYAMDTYLQMLFTMKLTDDCRLVKRAIYDFASSLTAGDIYQSRFPSTIPQYITGFSLYFIYMLDALERNRGEHTFIKKYLGTIQTIISAFEEMKRADGLLGKNEYWNFIDWADGWEEGHGVPPSKVGDALTVLNLMYAYALHTAARLFKLFGRNDTSLEYEENAQTIKTLVKKICYCKKTGLYAYTDQKDSFSQHAQIWAVLCQLDDPEAGRRMMKKSLSLTAKGGFAYAYFVFRAFEAVGAYELTEDLISQYRKLIDFHCTTIPEVPHNPQSECHGWGAVLIYEFTTVVLGVKDFEKQIIVKPYIKGRKGAKGTVYTKCGPVYVSWQISGSRFKIEVRTNTKEKIRIKLPDGTVAEGEGTLLSQCEIADSI